MIKRTCRLSAPLEFSLKATALSHGWHECAPMSWSEGGSCFQIIERHGYHVFRASVTERPGRPRASKTLDLTVDTDARNGAVIDDDVLEGITSRMRVTLGLDRDLSEFYELCANSEALCVVPRIGAGRLIRSASMTENILKMLCSTNVNWTQAVKMINRLGQLGPNLAHFRSLSAWPGPREILRAGDRYLRDVCRMGYRCDSILKFCRDVCERRFAPDSLDAMAGDPNASSKEIASLLRRIDGIGPTSANYLLGFLGRHDQLAIDSATLAHVAKTYTRGRKPTAKRIERIYARYGRWKNLACWLDNWLTWDTARGIVAERQER